MLKSFLFVLLLCYTSPVKTQDMPLEALYEPSEALIACLAAVIHYEAIGEPLKGQYAVADVILNRAAKNNTDVCIELKKPFQFSFMKGKRIPSAAPFAREMARDILVLEYYKYRVDNTHGSLYFFRHDVVHSLKGRLKFVKRIGQHVFYKEK